MASFSIQDLLGLPDTPPQGGKSASASEEGPSKQHAAVDASTGSGRLTEPPSKRRRQDVDSVGEDSPSSESDGDHESHDNDSSASGSPQKPKRLRTAFTVAQLRALEYAFRMCPYPDSYGREHIAKSTGIDEAKIQVWFQNRRARYRKREKPFEKERNAATSSALHSYPLSPYTPYTTPNRLTPPSVHLASSATTPHTCPRPPHPSYFPIPPGLPYPYYASPGHATPTFPGCYPIPVECPRARASVGPKAQRFTGGSKRSATTEATH